METTTLFPGAIDDLTYYSDMQLKDIATLNSYIGYLSNNDYINAAAVLNNSTSSLLLFNAKLMQKFDDRVCALGTYIKDQDAKPELGKYQTDEPTDAKDGTFWVD